ncbi:MAG TPA: GNAT family N-acetyltransferase [Casimicrobiaceae bacterium]|nr:GNAT family N-acetyltransferase [Casimicrobiaceae bacterium]
MTFTIQRLADEHRPAFLAHLLSLPPADRSLRFGTALAPRAIAAYVAHLDLGRDALFGVVEDDLSLAGAVHVAFESPHADIGVSVLPQRRRRGLGAALLSRALEHARNRGAGLLSMQYLSTNAPIMRLARRLGMEIASAGIETQAQLELPEPSAISIVCELLRDAFASCDGALKAFVAGWKHRNDGAAAAP